MSAQPAPSPSQNAKAANDQVRRSAKDVVLQNAANELVFAVVGHVGSGTSTIAEALKALLEGSKIPGGRYETVILKARDEIAQWAKDKTYSVPAGGRDDVRVVEQYQDLGDRMRLESRDNSAVARALVMRIRNVRAQKTGTTPVDAEPVRPDGKRRAYIIDSIRHPAEVQLLRHVYQDAFCLVGVVCEEGVRLDRLTRKYSNAGRANAEAFMKRDAKANVKHGQRVSDAFHLSDFFVDNTVMRILPDKEENPDWDVNDHLFRLVRIVSHLDVVRPSIDETAMHHAYSASMRSACLSRQVGAALVDSQGSVVATGTNEVPKAGGGVYGEQFDLGVDDHDGDHRCVYRKLGGENPFCSSTVEQNKLVNRLISEIPELGTLPPERQAALLEEIRASGVGDLLEFSRAVHAEMDALISAGRDGMSTVGTRLFVTTFPCHYCARHIVTAGVDEVQFIEPYPKSRATDLHSDSIQTQSVGWKPPSEGGAHVLFRPFVGVAPRMYRRAFLKDRELKDGTTGKFEIGQPDWGSAWHLRATGYADLEASLAREDR